MLWALQDQLVSNLSVSKQRLHVFFLILIKRVSFDRIYVQSHAVVFGWQKVLVIHCNIFTFHII